MKVGIEAIIFYVPHCYLDLKTLAHARHTDYNKIGIGQEKMAVPLPDEDVVTMSANAATQALGRIDRETIDTIMFANRDGRRSFESRGYLCT